MNKQESGGMADTPDLGSGVERHASSSLVSPTRINRCMTLLLAVTITAGHMWKGHTHMWVSAAIIVVYLIMTEFLLSYQRRTIETLQEFHTICAWCRKIHYNDKYITFEEFLHEEYSSETSHGICEDCKNNIMRDMSV